jgi:hypothetical protein
MKTLISKQMETFIRSLMAGVLLELYGYLGNPDNIETFTWTAIGMIVIRQMVALIHDLIANDKTTLNTF